jgi:hypothetical protein
MVADTSRKKLRQLSRKNVPSRIALHITSGIFVLNYTAEIQSKHEHFGVQNLSHRLFLDPVHNKIFLFTVRSIVPVR